MMIIITTSNGMTIPIAIKTVTKPSVPVYIVGEVFVIVGVPIIAISHVILM